MARQKIDYGELLAFLAQYLDHESRRAVVGQAFFGHDNLLQRIDWTGNNRAFAYHLTRRLLDHGEIDGKPALIVPA